jgi:hypothetical protein
MIDLQSRVKRSPFFGWIEKKPKAGGWFYTFLSLAKKDTVSE